MRPIIDVNKIKSDVTNKVISITTTNKTEVNQINEGAVVSGNGAVTFIQSNSNSTNNIVENILNGK